VATELKPGAARAILHFGMHKTGSSSIKASLFRNLADEHFHYVHLDGHASVSSNIATGFMEDPMRFHVHVKLGLSTGELRELRARSVERLKSELRAAGGRTSILSSEVIGYLHEPELRDMCGLIAAEGGAPVAVGYVRRPKELMESGFQQTIKGGLEDFRGSLRWGKVPNYPARLGKFDAVLGQDNVRLWLFDPASFPDGCVVRDFCSRLGIDFPAGSVLRVNEGISLPALSLLYAYRKFGPGYGTGPHVIRENRLLVERVSTLPGPKLRLHSSLVAPVLRRRREEIAWLEARLGTSLAEDIAAHDDGAVRSEEDLLKFTPEALQWLAGELGAESSARWRPDMSPRDVADRVHRLRVKLAAEADEQDKRAGAGVAGWIRRLRGTPATSETTPSAVPAAPATTTPARKPRGRHGDATMKIEEIARSARQSAKLDGVKEEDAAALVREVFQQILKEIEGTSEGKIRLDGLGQFRVRMATREKDGRKVKRIAFRAPGSDDE
jgi:nucleoid DNA-binding protein